jgi:hypoxia up-regulated 1
LFGLRSPKPPAFVVTRKQEKKRTYKRVLKIVSYHVGKVKPYSPELMAESKAKLAELARKDMERINLEAARNKVESYIYAIKNKLADNEDEIAKISTEEQRAELLTLAEEAEAWMEDDGYDAGLEAFEAKYELMATPAEKVWFRLKESTLRPATVVSMTTKLGKVEELMTKWNTTMPQVTEEEKQDVLDKVAEVKKWLEEKQAEQAKLAGHEDPAFTSEEIPLQAKPIEKLVSKLSKKPKPKPVIKKKEENKTETGNETDTTTFDLNATTPEKDETIKEAEEVKTEAKEEAETKEGEEASATGAEFTDEEL